MKFIIRDDDLNFFSTRADIERWYTDVFAKSIPVTFAAIPFVRGTSDVYIADAPKDETEYPISVNAELCAYLKDNSLIEVIQHGTTHQTKKGVYEYARASGLIEETKRGKAELECAIGKPLHSFAPPHDWIGTHGVAAIEAAGLNIIRGRGAGLRNWLWRWRYGVIFVRVLWFKSTHALAGWVPAYPFVLDFGKHKELCSYRLEDTDVFEGLKYAHEKDGIFIVVTHLHFYTDEKKLRLLKLIEQARSYKTQFSLPRMLFGNVLSTL